MYAFQSTLPNGSDPIIREVYDVMTISIHAPKRERRHIRTDSTYLNDFNPRSQTGATHWDWDEQKLKGISIHAPKRERLMEQLITNAADVVDEKERLRKFSEVFSFTERESEVFNCLVNTEDSIQMIAEKLYVSRRTLERHISAIYEKTGVKSRVGLLNLYNK